MKFKIWNAKTDNIARGVRAVFRKKWAMLLGSRQIGDVLKNKTGLCYLAQIVL